jgi:hypothetical protein
MRFCSQMKVDQFPLLEQSTVYVERMLRYTACCGRLAEELNFDRQELVHNVIRWNCNPCPRR